MKPRILLTSRPSDDAAPIGESPFREYVYQSYADALRDNGAIVTIVPISEPEDAHVILSAADAIVVAGGRDVNPHCYGQDPVPETQEPHDRLDASDFALIESARKTNTPLLAICRGMQMLNVVAGGSLYQDIAGKKQHHPILPATYEERVAYRHMVTLETDSWLAKVFSETRIETNSIHHQSVDALGEGLRIVGRADDGVVEAIESTTDWFAVGTQWHPELLQNPEVLFKAFVDEVSAHRSAHDRREYI